MENEQSSDLHEFVLRSGARLGLKRELAFALKSHAQLPSFLGRTRSGKASSVSPVTPSSSGGKRYKSSDDRGDQPAIFQDLTDGPIIFSLQVENPVDASCSPLGGDDVDISTPYTRNGGCLKSMALDLASPEMKEKPSQYSANDGIIDDMEKHAMPVEELNQNYKSSNSEAKQKNSAVIIPTPLLSLRQEVTSSESNISSSENESAVKQSTMFNVRKGSKLRKRLADKRTRRFTRSALKLVPAAATAPKKKKKDKPFEITFSSKFTQKLKMPAITEQDKSEEVISDSAALITIQQGNLVDIPIIFDNFGELDFENGQLNQLLKAKYEGPIPVTIILGVTDDNDKEASYAESPVASTPTCVWPAESEDSKVDINYVFNGDLSLVSKKKMELKMSKKITLTKPPSNVRELLSTGYLEGLPVKYISSPGKNVGLHGIIMGNGVLCFCTYCHGTKVVSAYQFEIHAGSTKKHPSDFIFLQNGKSIREVLRLCNGASVDMLESAIKNAIGPLPITKLSICQRCKKLDTTCAGNFTFFCNSCIETLNQQATPMPSEGMSNPAKLPRRVLISFTSNGAPKNSPLQKKPCFGKLTRKDLGLHKLVFMDDILPQGTEVGYYVRGKRLLEGYIKESGIFCRCCNGVVSPSQFEAHAGQASRRKPYNNIYTSNGVSLHELSVSLSKGRKMSSTENDDLCGICADGGDLLLCDFCPRAFHKECLGLSNVPTGDWFCQYCQNLHQKDKCLAISDNAIAAGRVAGVDPIEQIIKRCIRIVTTPENEAGVCALCRQHDYSRSGFDGRTVIICDQCESEYHVGCLKDHGMADLQELPEGEWFCRPDCSRIRSSLQELLLQGPETLDELDANIIKKKLDEKGLSMDSFNEVRWRILSGKSDSVEGKLLLTETVSLFRESFDPIVDPISDRDLIPFMVYGGNIRDQDFGGVYCIVLTAKTSVVSAGLLRVLGCEIAELPLVATKREYHGLGYFQSLFSCIEKILKSLKVKHFVLPAADEAESMWTNKFGFAKLTPTELKEYAKGLRPIIFQGTSMLHKLVDDRHEPPLATDVQNLPANSHCESS